MQEQITSRSSGDNGYTWTQDYAEPSLSAAIAHAKVWTNGQPDAIHVIERPVGELIIVRDGRLFVDA